MRKDVFWILTLVLGLVLVSGAAWAEKPIKDEFLFTGQADYRFVTCDDEYRPEEGDLFFDAPIYCDNGIVICETADASITSKSFFDKEGNRTRYWEKGQFTGAFYEYQNYENRIEYGPLKSGAFLIDYGDPDDPADDTYNYRGLVVRVRIPGYGHFFIDAGRFVLGADFATPVFYAGQHPYFNGEFGPVCEYLADYY